MLQQQQQQIKVDLVIPIPEDKVLIDKVKLEELENNQLHGKVWNMKDLEKHIGRKDDWIRENILYVPRFRKILDAKQGGFVVYPVGKGKIWAFQAQKMVEFIEKHFYEIFS